MLHRKAILAKFAALVKSPFQAGDQRVSRKAGKMSHAKTQRREETRSKVTLSFRAQRAPETRNLSALRATPERFLGLRLGMTSVPNFLGGFAALREPSPLLFFGEPGTQVGDLGEHGAATGAACYVATFDALLEIPYLGHIGLEGRVEGA